MGLLLELAVYTVLIGLLGCRAERVGPVPDQRADAPAAAATVATSAPAPAAPSSASESSAPASTHMAWGDKINWRSWDSALSEARSQGKSICVVVYAEWCDRCKELSPVFASPEVASAAADLLMVHQDQDQHPPWLQEHLGAYGNYIPRVLFLTPEGKVREDLTSGHPRYPYFYAPMVADQLAANMRAAKTR